MTGLGLLYLILITLLITSIFSYGFRMRGPWGTVWTFFLIILLSVLAADIWIHPIGPYYKDVYWLPPLAVGLLIAFLLAATTPPNPKLRSRIEQQKLLKEKLEEREELATYTALGVFFWILLIFLLGIVLIGIFNNV